MLSQYKELIREQDSRIVQISQANIYLQQELAKAKQLTEDMAINVQTLQDQNSLLKAQNNTTNVITTVPPTNGISSQSEDEIKRAKETSKNVPQTTAEMADSYPMYIKNLYDITYLHILSEKKIKNQALNKRLYK